MRKKIANYVRQIIYNSRTTYLSRPLSATEKMLSADKMERKPRTRNRVKEGFVAGIFGRRWRNRTRARPSNSRTRIVSSDRWIVLYDRNMTAETRTRDYFCPLTDRPLLRIEAKKENNDLLPFRSVLFCSFERVRSCIWSRPRVSYLLSFICSRY